MMPTSPEIPHFEGTGGASARRYCRGNGDGRPVEHIRFVVDGFSSWLTNDFLSTDDADGELDDHEDVGHIHNQYDRC